MESRGWNMFMPTHCLGGVKGLVWHDASAVKYTCLGMEARQSAFLHLLHYQSRNAWSLRLLGRLHATLNPTASVKAAQLKNTYVVTLQNMRFAEVQLCFRCLAEDKYPIGLLGHENSEQSATDAMPKSSGPVTRLQLEDYSSRLSFARSNPSRSLGTLR